MEIEIKRLSNGKGNYFFGFHDLIAWNKKGDKLVALRIDNISLPPDIDRPCEIGYIQDDGEFIKLGVTYAYNYPQGARQQWICNSDSIIVNDLNNDHWCSRIYDTLTNKLISTLDYPTHIVTDEGWAFGLNYARLHRLGGYGYTGLKDKTVTENIPENDGIIKHNIYTRESSLLVSIKQVADCQPDKSIGEHHYLTHLVLNPSQNRIAFLHRYKLADGGETTRLMSIDTNGKNLRCLAVGFLSHFDWKDNESITIWGRTGSSAEKIRSSFFYKILPKRLLVITKKTAKQFLKKIGKNRSNYINPSNWLLITDSNIPEISFLAKDIITQDGHPMFCPSNRDWMICDTYPNIEGERELFLFQCSSNKKIHIGMFKMLENKPILDEITQKALVDVEHSVIKTFSIENMAFYRSGLHCDLHPRWMGDGSMVAFDSIHDGTRQIYACSVKEFLV